MDFRRIAGTVTLLALSLAPGALANVSLKNGNFYIGYTDIIYPGGFEPKIERVYNSKTPYKGIFGFGWGNEYEAYVSVSADGSIVIHEYGGGAENRFSPKAFNSGELDKAIDMIANAAKSAGAITSKDAIESYKKHLRSDAIFRNDEWELYRQTRGLKPRPVAPGTKLFSNRFSYQTVTRIAGGYERAFDNGRTERFNDQGKLARISDKNRNFIELTYGRDGHLEKITDNFNRKIFFTFNDHGLVSKIQGENGKEANYKYNSADELVQSKDVDGNTYAYKYSADGRHNMSEVAYSDRTTLTIAYYDKSKQENVKSVKDRDGTLTDYSYDTDPRDKGHLTVGVRVKGSDGKLISSSKYDYFLRNKADGEEWTYKLVADLDGDVTTTVYNECCGMPLSIRRGSEETTFEYDDKGHVRKKTTPTEITELQYHPTLGKVTKVTRFSKLTKKQTSWSTFEYNTATGNLEVARNSDKKQVRLVYDMNGRIRTMIDQDQRRIDFKYNEHSKPIEISDPKLGSITVQYANSGEIKKVESTAGRRIAMQVTSAFQNLLDIIRPAGVSLSF